MATSQSIQEQVKQFQARSAQAKVKGGGVVHAATEQEAKALAEKVEAKDTPEPVAPEPEPVEPKQFPVSTFKMGGVEGYVAVFTMQDVKDYICYARELYDVVGDESGTLTGLEKEKQVNPADSWQRRVDLKRADKEIRPYLEQSLHFFPPIVCVIAKEDVSVDKGLLTCTEGGIAALDGQHRKAGIEGMLALVGPDSAFAQETIPVVIIGSDIGIDERQQIFADVNRSAKVVSKAINILFDHRDKYAGIAQAMAADLNADGKDMVDLTKTAPAPKSSHVCSLSNIYNLVNNFGSSSPKLHNADFRNMVKDGADTPLTAQLIRDVCEGVLTAFPLYQELQKNNLTYKDVRNIYICYSSTLFQAIGIALKTRLMFGVHPDSWVDAAKVLISTTKWEKSAPIWANSGLVDEKGSVGTRTDHVAKAASVLETEWAKIQDLPGMQVVEQK